MSENADWVDDQDGWIARLHEAEANLRRFLTAEQLTWFDYELCFPVTTRSGKYFIVDLSDTYNATEYEEAPVLGESRPYLLDQWCMVVSDEEDLPVPSGHLALATKLMLEGDEEGFYAVANRYNDDDEEDEDYSYSFW